MIPAPYLLIIKIGLIGVLFAAVFGYGHHLGSKGVQARWDSEKAQTTIAIAKLKDENEKHNAEILAQHQADNVKVSQDHEQALQAVTQKYNTDLAAIKSRGGLRIPVSACSSSTTTGTKATSDSGRNEDSTGTIALPEQITNDLFSFANEADEVTEQLRACQSWIVRSGFYESQIQDH